MQKTKLLSESSLSQNLYVNPTKIYNYISSIKSENQIPLSVYFGSNLDEDRAKLFNHCFNFHHCTKYLILLHQICFDEFEVYTVLTSLERNKAAGIDGIRSDVLKHCTVPLTKLSIIYFASNI